MKKINIIRKMRNIYIVNVEIEKLPGKQHHTLGQTGCWTKTQYLKLFYGKKYKRNKKK